MKNGTLRSLVFLAILLLGSCRQERPSNIPVEAVFVPAGKGGFWQTCRFESTNNEDRCQIYNKVGQTIYDENFVPFDAGPPATASELIIAQYDRPPYGGPDRICLQNGRVLIPQSRADALREFLTPYRGKGCQ